MRKSVLGGVLTALVLFTQIGFAQGVFESFFGGGTPGADALTGPQMFQGTAGAEQSFMAQAQGGQQAPGAQSAQGYGGYQYPSHGGIYSDWHTYLPGAKQPQQAQQPVQAAQPVQPQQAPQPPPVTYRAPQQPPQAPQPRQAVPASQTPRQPPQAVGGAQAQPQAQRPGLDAEQLPAGAIQITTTTPEGTVSQYYAPPGQAPPPVQDQAVQPQAQRAKPGPAQSSKKTANGAKRRVQSPAAAPAAPGAPAGEAAPSGVAMPKPVQAPAGKDPRTGWAPPASPAHGAKATVQKRPQQ
jgi:hypothetical protein